MSAASHQDEWGKVKISFVKSTWYKGTFAHWLNLEFPSNVGRECAPAASRSPRHGLFQASAWAGQLQTALVSMAVHDILFFKLFFKRIHQKKKKKRIHTCLSIILFLTQSLCAYPSLSQSHLVEKAFGKKKKKVLGFIHWFFYFVVIVSYFINPSFIYIDFFLLPKVI